MISDLLDKPFAKAATILQTITPCFDVVVHARNNDGAVRLILICKGERALDLTNAFAVRHVVDVQIDVAEGSVVACLRILAVVRVGDQL